MVARWTDPDYTSQSQSGTTYPVNIDGALAVAKRFGDCWGAHEATVGSPAPDLTVAVDAGFLWDGTTLIETGAQTVSGFTVPAAGNTRIDRVVIDATSGAASRVAGAEVTTGGSPSATPPAIPSGKIPIAKVTIASTHTAITNDMITDERAFVTKVGSTLTAAVQADQETGTDTTVYVSPGTQHYHQSAAKAVMLATVSAGTPTLRTPPSYNITSIGDTAAGRLTVTIATDFSSANWCTIASIEAAGSASTMYTCTVDTGSRAAGSVILESFSVDETGPVVAFTDPDSWSMAGFGDQ